MLRRILHNKAGQVPQLKSISKSLFGFNKAFCTNVQLEEGEYIEGDLNLGPTAAETRQYQRDFQKKYVGFDNFGKNLVRQSPKASGNYKNEIKDSVQRIKSKFNFELAENDQFAQELAQREQKKVQKPEGRTVLTRERASEEATQKIKDVLENYGKDAFQQLEKNLKKIEPTGRLAETALHHPTQKKIAEIIDKVGEEGEKSTVALQQYNLGEEGIDFITPGEDPAKLMTNIQAEIINTIADQFELTPKTRNSVNRINEWRLSKEIQSHGYVIEDEPPIPYPGSSKGRHPMDDADFFVEWLTNNMPKSHMRFYKNLVKRTAEEREGLGAQKPLVTGVEHFIESPVPITELGLSRPEEQMVDQKDAPLVFRSHLDKQRGEIDLLPDVVGEVYQEAQDDIEKWTLFRLYPMINNWYRMLGQAIADINNPEVAARKVKPLPTLLRYYSLLPEFARTNPIVMDVVRAFEFHKHDLSLKEKETAVNFACQFALPMEFDLEDSMKEAVISTKYFVPLWEEVTLMDDNREQDSKAANLLGEKKKKAGPIKLIEEVLETGEGGVPEDLRHLGDWQAPDKLDPYVPEEDPFPVLPIDYYDNEDGFWNDYIAAKEATYDEIPMIISRPYFKH